MRRKANRWGILLICILVYLLYANWEQMHGQAEAGTIMPAAKTEYIDGSFFLNVYDGSYASKKIMKYSSKGTVEKLKMVYNEIEFYDEFNVGDLEEYDYYAEKYTRLLKHEARFYYPADNAYYEIHYDYEDLKHDSLTIYLFDMDEDGKPELCLAGVFGIFVYKYIPETDQYVEWWSCGGGSAAFLGSRRYTQYGLKGIYIYEQFSKSGETECRLYLREYKTVEDPDRIYLVSLPTYREGIRQADIIDDMSNEGYYEEQPSETGGGVCYFRVTETEYLEITAPYEEAVRAARAEGQEFIFNP